MGDTNVMTKKGSKDEKALKKQKRSIIILILVIIVLALLFALKGCDKIQSALVNRAEIDINQAKERGAKPGMADQIEVPGYPEIPLQAGSRTMRVALENPKGNNVWFEYELVLAKTGESLYKSKYIKPGNVISTQTLKRGLKKGTYDAVLKIRTVTADETHAKANGMDSATKLIVN